MPFRWGQLFTKNPYDNTVDPDTGLTKRPSVWQSIAWPEASSDVRRANFAIIQDPYETQRQATRIGALAQPEAQAAATKASALIPARLDEAEQLGELRHRQAMQFAPAEYEAMTPATIDRDRKQLENTEKTLDEIHHRQAVTTVALARKMGLVDKLGSTYSTLSDDELATLAKNDPTLNGILNTVAAGNKITEGLPQIQAHLDATRLKLQQLEAEEEINNVKRKHGMLGAQYEAEGRRLSEINRLGVPEAQAGAEMYRTTHGMGIAETPGQPIIGTLDPKTGSVIFDTNPANKMASRAAYENTIQAAKPQSPAELAAIKAGFGSAIPVNSRPAVISPVSGTNTPLAAQVTRPPSVSSLVLRGIADEATKPVREAYNKIVSPFKWSYENITKPTFRVYKSIYEIMKEAGEIDNAND